MRLPSVRGLALTRGLSLTGSLFVGCTLLLTVATAGTAGLWIAHHDRELDRQYTERVLTIARSVALMPEVTEALGTPEAASVINPLANRVVRATGAQYVVVATPDGTRMSHVDAELVGKRVSTPPGPAAAGHEWSGEQTGTQGRSVRAKVPVTREGEVVGYVSVGVLSADIDTEVTDALPVVVGTTATVLVLGGTGAYVLSRRVRAKTYGLEPAEITALLESREALLHGVREGVLAVDDAARLILVNPPAREMLGLAADSEGRALAELPLDGRLRDIVTGAAPGADQIVLAGARILVCNRMPIRLRGRTAGAVVTLRDRTELDRLTGELDGARTVTQALRAQSHEFANRIHTVAGMLELGATDEARGYLAGLTATHTRTSEDIGHLVADPALAALALAKSAQAAEQGAELRLSPMSEIPAALPGPLRSDVLLVLGNLVDNALDSVAATGPPGADPGWVEVLLRLHRAEGPPEAGDVGDPAGSCREGLPQDLVEVRVTDSGHGVAAELAEEIFGYGFTTKAAGDSGTRGLGLALVRQVCERRAGSIGVEIPDGTEGEEGAVFTAWLPVSERGGAPAATGAVRA